jgi:two-component system copper resistance phosphate regulon response regulator CusR
LRILLIEDEESIGGAVQQGLQEERYVVDWARDGRTGLDFAAAQTYALIVLDVMLPGVDGWTICRTLRTRRDTTPILMLTARDAVEDRVRGLEMGADDYLPKPFDFGELLARVRALLRRAALHKGRVIQIADLSIDTKQRRVLRSGQEVSLTPREYSLLEALAVREGQTLTREVILEHVWMNEESLPNTVDVYVGMLRRKIDAGREGDAKLIRTMHGLGYSLRSPQIPDPPAHENEG